MVKRLLGLAHVWAGSTNGVQLQLWATWVLYAVLVDITDAVAEELSQPFATLSLEIVYRSLSFFTAAYQRGAGTKVAPYLAAEAIGVGIGVGIVKRPRARAAPSLFAHQPYLVTNALSGDFPGNVVVTPVLLLQVVVARTPRRA